MGRLNPQRRRLLKAIREQQYRSDMERIAKAQHTVSGHNVVREIDLFEPVGRPAINSARWEFASKAPKGSFRARGHTKDTAVPKARTLFVLPKKLPGRFSRA